MRAKRWVVAATAMVASILVTSSQREDVFAATTFVVDSSLDAADVSPGNGRCETGAGTCTLRAAVQESNALSGPDTIEVPPGTYNLTVFGAAEDASSTGDLDVTSPLTIVGAGAATTFVDGNGSDRVLHLLETAGNVTVGGLTIRDGLTEEDGGGIYSLSGGTLVLDGVTVTANATASDGGGIHTASGTLRGPQRQRGVRQRGSQRRGHLQRRRAEHLRRSQPGVRHRIDDHRQHGDRGRRWRDLERPRGQPHADRRHRDRQPRQRQRRRRRASCRSRV